MVPSGLLEFIENRAGWILVGGRSSRMGSDKAFLEVEGRPLALRIAERIAPACTTVCLVGDPGRYSGLGLPVVPDRFAGEGPLAGIESALRETHADWNLIVACDMPSLSASLLSELFDLAMASDCALPRYEGGKLEPLCGVYHRRCHGAVLRAIEHGTRKITDALQGLAIRYLQVTSADPFANLNTPEDLRRYGHG